MTTPDREAKPAAYLIVGDSNWLQFSPLVAEADKPHVHVVPLYTSPIDDAYEPMREALAAARDAIASLDKPALGYESAGDGSAYWPVQSVLLNQIDAALSTLPVNDRHHSGSDNERLRAALRELLAASDPARCRGTDRELDARERAVTALKSTDRQTSDDAGRLRALLEEELVWHEERDKSLSKQPPFGEKGWRRAEHQERIDVIRAALKGVPQPASDDYQADAGAPALSEKVNRAAEWLPIETAPKDGTQFIGLIGRRAATVESAKIYVKWPHEDGGPTFSDIWHEVRPDALIPCSPTHWMPLPSPPGAELTISNDAGSDGGENA